MSTTGFRWGGILALTLATAIVGGREAEAGYYYRETAPTVWENEGILMQASGRGLEMRVNEQFTISSIDVWANTLNSSGWETQMKIFQLGEPGALPGTLMAHNEATHATNSTWDWMSFDFDYTFQRETSYVLYWYGLGELLPWEAGTWSTPASHPEFTVVGGVSDGSPVDGTPTAVNSMTPQFRLKIESQLIPEPSVAMMALTMGGLLVLRRKR